MSQVYDVPAPTLARHGTQPDLKPQQAPDIHQSALPQDDDSADEACLALLNRSARTTCRRSLFRC